MVRMSTIWKYKGSRRGILRRWLDRRSRIQRPDWICDTSGDSGPARVVVMAIALKLVVLA
jgi:hypothetical protein